MKKGKRRMTTDEYKKIVSASVSEEAEQIHLMQWCTWAQNKYPELEAIYHVPNEGKRSAVTGGKLRQMGLRSGVPDICLPVPKGEYIGLYIELKKVGGRLTDNQAVWLEMLERYGHCVAVCYGAEDAETVITAYLEQDIGTLDRHTLKRSRGDFKELKKRRRSSSKALYEKAICIAMAVLQSAATVADIVINGAITGRSLVIVLALSVAALFTMVRDVGHG